MNIIFFGILIALVLWGIVHEIKFLGIYLGLLVAYHIWHKLR